ncbi:MAG: undecaprenyl-diphosphate phosphatase [Cytophagales bacterium]|nr:undecaprenyl-diphosphate phosphatase [Cytophagales bacterium]
MSIFEIIILAIVEGITEFLPISSTGHMILVSHFFGNSDNAFVKLFTVNIQFGAILSVVLIYRKKFFKDIDFYIKLGVAVLPAAAIGFLFGDFVDTLLENVIVVAVTLILGGVVLILSDKWFLRSIEDKPISTKNSLIIGFFQCLALVPGVSRSGATIIGGLVQGWSRTQAAEFSFFLAVPTMFLASGYKLVKGYQLITVEHIEELLLGNLVAFIFAMLAIKFFIGYLTKNGFKIFGYYRIILGCVILVLYTIGHPLQVL